MATLSTIPPPNGPKKPRGANPMDDDPPFDAERAATFLTTIPNQTTPSSSYTSRSTRTTIALPSALIAGFECTTATPFVRSSVEILTKRRYRCRRDALANQHPCFSRRR
ncbi:UNVERIFIED_CONTAM: hypothetical protein Slati_0422900 [Sesamum latifolium]|uniref:Uncharacterized protein n=1 Tax=Sesamum latifolium TaxID=2727402 RepID=A0AAW2XVE5_9LAMI